MSEVTESEVIESEITETAEPETAGPGGDAPSRRIPLWTLVMLYAGAAFAATMTSSPGVWIADARLEFSTDPSGFLAGHQYLWDETRGMGNTATFFSPLLGSYQALVSQFVSEPWIIERLVHTLLLTVAATSMALLVRVAVPRMSWLHLVAGLLYAFNPYTSQFLLPSGLFLSYAISPLLLAALLRGVSIHGEAWRTAAVFALGIFSVGALNTAALAYASLPMVVALVYVVLIERSSSWATAAGWVGRAVLLTMGVSAAAAVVLWLQLGDVALNLATTEQPATVSARSSWAESWRGLGMWLTYYRDSYGPLRPQAAPYFENYCVVVTSYAAPTAAAVALVFSRWRPRYFFGALIGLGVLVMVGLWPIGAPSPVGRILGWSFDNVALLRGLRTTYKAGAIFSIGVAALAAVAVVWGRHGHETSEQTTALESAPPGRARTSWALSATLSAALVVAAVPFWTGGVYNGADGFEDIPEYWSEAIDWLNAQPEDGRVMVLPGVIRAQYRWGYINDNLFHGLLDKSMVAHQSIPPPGTPVAADVVRNLDEYIASSAFVPGSLGPILRRLGVHWVVFQNDLDWERLGIGRPASLDEVRSDPSLRPVAAFGEVGQNTTARGDPVAAVLGEDQLQPVEVFEVTDPADTIRVELEPPLVVSGGGDSWAQLSLAGFLDSGPVAYPSLMTDEELADVVAAGSAVVVTDGGRRRALQVQTGRISMSHTLGAEETFDRVPISPFPPDGQSVTVFPDAATIEATVADGGPLSFDPHTRPALAFDGRTDTAFAVAGPDAEGATVDVELTEPTALEQVTLFPLPTTFARFARVITLEIDRSDGSTVEFDAQVDNNQIGAPRVLDVGIADAVSFRLSLEELTGRDAEPVGITEVVVTTPDGALDLREFIQAPVDLRDASDRSPAVAEALLDADMSFSFSRSIGSGVADNEIDVRRHFWAPQDIGAVLSGTLRLSDSTPDVAADHLLAGSVGAVGSDRVPVLGGWGVNAVDGDPATSWLGTASDEAVLTVRPPATRFEEIAIVTAVSTGVGLAREEFSTIESLRIAFGMDDGVEFVDATPGPVLCSGASAAERCTRTFVADVPAVVARGADMTTFDVEVRRIDQLIGTFASRPIAISEVLFDGESGSPDDWGDTCVDGFVIDGRAVSIRFDGPADRLLDGDPVPFASCDEVTIAAGGASIESVPELGGAVSDLLIGGPPDTIAGATPTSPDEVTILERTPTRVVLSVSAQAAGTLLGPGSFHPGWRAFVEGEPLGGASPRDALSSWDLESGTDGTSDVIVTLEFRPQRTYELALAISIGTVALALVLVVGGRRRRPA